jgi:type II secretory pathway pseudopilin PulG
MTLVEAVAAVLIVAIIYLIFANTLGQFSKGVSYTKARTLANTIALEKIEILKNKNYYKLIPTSTSDLAASYSLSGFSYDMTYYPPEELYVGDRKFVRYTTVYKVSDDGNGNLVEEPDPSLVGETDIKKIKVRVEWQEDNKTKFFELSSLRENPNRIPLDAKFTGWITSTGVPTGDWVLTPPHNTSSTSPPNDRVKLDSARVVVVEDANYETYTDANGSYEIKLPTGSWSLYVTKNGYWSYTTPKYTVGKNQTQKLNVQLTQKLTGMVTGYAVYNPRLVISQIVASTVSPTGFDQEYVELYNPTTWSWRIQDDTFDLKIHTKGPGKRSEENILDVPLTFVNNTINSNGGYYLIANTETVIIAGVSIPADAYYSGAYYGADLIETAKAGAVVIADDYGNSISSVGWARTTSPSAVPDTRWYETQYTVLPQGIQEGYSLIRGAFMKGSGGWVSYNDGNAYDEHYNFYDFYVTQGAYLLVTSTTIPRNSSFRISPKWGKYALGGYVSADDGISSVYQITSWAGFFQLTMATGTWNVYVYKDNLFMKISSVTIRAGQTTGIPNNNTDPCWTPWPPNSVPVVILSSSTDSGYIYGTVTRMDTGAPLQNIKVEAGGYYGFTNANGMYVIAVPTLEEGTTYFITANPYPDVANNSLYISETKEAVCFLGRTTIVNFALTTGGRIRGRSVTPSGDALPGTVFTATKGTILKTASTDKDGFFEFINMSTGVWTVEPVLDSGESSSPATVSSNVVVGQTIFVATFTISGSLGTFYGRITKDGELVKSGVLIFASTTTIDVNSPPEINNQVRNGETIYFAVVSHNDGTYELPVKAGKYKIYLWYTEASRTKISTINKTYPIGGGTYTINAGEKVNIDFTLP